MRARFLAVTEPEMPTKIDLRDAIASTLLALLLATSTEARGDQIYNVTGGNGDFVPFENDGTPSRPNGDHLGNTITFAGTNRYLTHAQASLASIGPKELDTYTLDLYKNDGTLDPGSGLHKPGSLLGEYKTIVTNQPLPGNGGFYVDWNFAPLLVPDTVTAVLSSSYSTTTPGQLMGPFVAVRPPLTGSAANTIWYGDGTPGGWTANNTWALNDGGVTNYIGIRFDAGAVPEPASALLLGLGALLSVRRIRSKSQPSTNKPSTPARSPRRAG